MIKKLFYLSSFIITIMTNIVAWGLVEELELTDPLVTRGSMSLPFGDLNDLSDLTPGRHNYNYLLTTFVPTNSESYTLGITSAPFDPVIILYSGDFDPSSPATNALALSEFNPQGAQITYNLIKNQPYNLIITTYNSDNQCDLPITFYTSGPVTFRPRELPAELKTQQLK